MKTVMGFFPTVCGELGILVRECECECECLFCLCLSLCGPGDAAVMSWVTCPAFTL